MKLASPVCARTNIGLVGIGAMTRNPRPTAWPDAIGRWCPVVMGRLRKERDEPSSKRAGRAMPTLWLSVKPIENLAKIVEIRTGQLKDVYSPVDDFGQDATQSQGISGDSLGQKINLRPFNLVPKRVQAHAQRISDGWGNVVPMVCPGAAVLMVASSAR